MENNEIQVSKSNQVGFEEMIRMSDAFVKSGMFPDMTSVAKAFVKIQAGQEMGVKPFAAMTGIHIIKGKPTAGSAILASRIKANPKYNFKVVRLDNDACSLDFYENGTFSGNSSFTIEDAIKAGTQNTEKFPRNMLFARAISNGQKWYAPDVFDFAVYTEYEIEKTDEKVEITKEDKAEKEFNRFKELVERCITQAQIIEMYSQATSDKERALCEEKADQLAIPKEKEIVIPLIDVIQGCVEFEELKKIKKLVLTQEHRDAYDIKFKELNPKK